MIIGPTLGRYLSLRFTRTMLAIFATVFALIYTLDFVELMRRAGDTPGASAAKMANLALLRTPAVAEQILPFAVLFGAMVTLLNLSRKLELVVARAAGISAWQFLQPGLLVSAVIGLVSVGLYNPVSAHLKQRATEMESRIFARVNAPGGRDIWLRQKSVDGSAIIRAGSTMGNSPVLEDVTVFTFDQNGGFRERIEAKMAALEPRYWRLTDARVISPAEEPQSYGTYLLATTLEPAQVHQAFLPPQAVPFWDLSGVIKRTEESGLDATPYRMQRASLFARPLLFVAMVLVAASVSLRFFRFGGIAQMVLGGVAAGFMLYVATELMEDLGAAGLIGSSVAAWFPAVVGSLLGVLALLHQEDG